MNRKQFIFTLSVALLSGLMGGVLSIWFLMPPSVLAQDEPQKVIEAEEFRVMDENGDSRVFIGTFPDGSVGLSVKDQTGNDRALVKVLLDGSPAVGVVSEDERRGAILAVTNELAQLRFDGRSQVQFYDKENTKRAAVDLASSGTPSLLFNDENGTSRIWMTLENGVNPKLELFDSSGHTRAALGTTQLKNTRTGSTEIRAPSSLVLFDEEGKVVWSAP